MKEVITTAKKRDLPVSMKVQPDLYERLKDIKEKGGFKNIREAQDRMLEIIDRIAPPEERIPEHLKAYLDKRIKEEGHAVCSAVGTVTGKLGEEMNFLRGHLGALEDRVKENAEAVLHAFLRIDGAQKETRDNNTPLKVTTTIEGITLEDLRGVFHD